MRCGSRAEWPRGRVRATEISFKEISSPPAIGQACDQVPGSVLLLPQELQSGSHQVTKPSPSVDFMVYLP